MNAWPAPKQSNFGVGQLSRNTTELWKQYSWGTKKLTEMGKLFWGLTSSSSGGIFKHIYERGRSAGWEFQRPPEKGKKWEHIKFQSRSRFPVSKSHKTKPAQEKTISRVHWRAHTTHDWFQKTEWGKCFSTCCKLVNKTMLPTKLFVRSVWTSWGFLPKKRLSKKGPA